MIYPTGEVGKGNHAIHHTQPLRALSFRAAAYSPPLLVEGSPRHDLVGMGQAGVQLSSSPWVIRLSWEGGRREMGASFGRKLKLRSLTQLEEE